MSDNRALLRGLSLDRGVNVAIVVFNALLIAVLWSVVVGLVQNERDETVRVAIDRNDNLAVAFEQYTTRTLDGAALVIKYLIREYERNGKRVNLGKFAVDLAIGEQSIAGIVLADERGDAVGAAYSGGAGALTNVADREHFSTHVGRDSGQLFVAKPVIGRATGKPVIPVTRRINKADGTFGGVAMALIEPPRFIDVVLHAKLRPSDVMTLIGMDGVTRARRRGETLTWGDDGRKSPLFAQLAMRPDGHYFAKGQLDGVPKFFSYRSLPKYQLVVLVGTAEADVLAEFNSRQNRYFWAAGLVSVLIAGFSIALMAVLALQRQAAATIARNQARFHTTFNQAAIGIANSALDGRYLEVNQSFCNILGYTKEDLLARTFVDVTHPDDLAANIEFRKRLMEAPGAVSAGAQEKRYIRKDQTTVWCLWTAAVVYDENANPAYVVTTVNDISERKKLEQERRLTEEKLRLSESRLVSAQHIAKVGDWETDLATLSVNCSAQTHRIFETDPATFQPSHERLLELVHPDDRKMVNDAFVASSAKNSIQNIEHRLLLSGGRIKFVVERWRVTMDENGKPLRATGTCQDITAQKEAEVELRNRTARLQRLSRQLMSVEEQERRRIGRELHDRIGANLNALLLGIEVFQNKLPPALAQEIGSRFEGWEALLRETIEHVRDVLADLRPPALDELGLLAALNQYVSLLARHVDMEIAMKGREPSPRLPPDVEIALFRIAQEALNNATRHAWAAHITVELLSDDAQVTLMVADDGKGIDATLSRFASSSFGLQTMRERAEGINARLVVESSRDEGTRIMVTMPYPHERREKARA